MSLLPVNYNTACQNIAQKFHLLTSDATSTNIAYCPSCFNKDHVGIHQGVVCKSINSKRFVKTRFCSGSS